MNDLKAEKIFRPKKEATINSIEPSLCQDKNELINNEQNDKLLRLAEYENNPELIKEIIQAGAEINTFDESGATALHIATHFANNDVVAILIELKANLNDKDQQGNTALHYAVITKNKVAAEALIAVGANPNIKNNDNQTALKIAQKRNDHKMLKILLPTVIHKVKFYNKKT